MKKIPFDRIEVSRENLLKMFSYNKFKTKIIEEKIKSDKATIYRCGTLIDLCAGPHIFHTGRIKAFKLLNVRYMFYNMK